MGSFDKWLNSDAKIHQITDNVEDQVVEDDAMPKGMSHYVESFDQTVRPLYGDPHSRATSIEQFLVLGEI
jgi:hypothetical protein